MYYLYLLMVFIQSCVLGHLGVGAFQWEAGVMLACLITTWIAGNERGEKFGGRK